MPEYQYKNQTWNLDASGDTYTLSSPSGSVRLKSFECDHHSSMPIDEGDLAHTREMYAAEGQYVSIGTERNEKKHLSIGVQGMHADFYDVPPALVEDLFKLPVIKTK